MLETFVQDILFFFVFARLSIFKTIFLHDLLGCKLFYGLLPLFATFDYFTTLLYSDFGQLVRDFLKSSLIAIFFQSQAIIHVDLYGRYIEILILVFIKYKENYQLFKENSYVKNCTLQNCTQKWFQKCDRFKDIRVSVSILKNMFDFSVYF